MLSQWHADGTQPSNPYSLDGGPPPVRHRSALIAVTGPIVRTCSDQFGRSVSKGVSKSPAPASQRRELLGRPGRRSPGGPKPLDDGGREVRRLGAQVALAGRIEDGHDGVADPDRGQGRAALPHRGGQDRLDAVVANP